jgi:hypothetical protein
MNWSKDACVHESRHTSAGREKRGEPVTDRLRIEGRGGVREKESFLLKSIDGKSTPLLRSAPDRVEPPPGRTTPSLAPDTANDAIPARPDRGRSEPTGHPRGLAEAAAAHGEASARVGGMGRAGRRPMPEEERREILSARSDRAAEGRGRERGQGARSNVCGGGEGSGSAWGWEWGRKG